MTKAAHRIDPRDHVATALRALSAGERLSVDGVEIMLRNDIPHGHKFAVESRALGEPVLKFGFPIGVATQPIQPGDHVHTHNVATALKGQGEYTYANSPSPRERTQGEGPTFNGYLREDGRAATRNE